MAKKLFFMAVLMAVAIGSTFSQSGMVVLDAKNGSIDDVVYDLILDKDIYNNKTIVIKNAIYPEFGSNPNTGFFKAVDWFEDAGTYRINQTNVMRSNNFQFIFHPSQNDREGRKLMLDLNGKYYTSPKAVTLEGKFVAHQIQYGRAIYPFLITSLEINGQKYSGEIPNQIEERW
jgi:hypothetical protein